MKQQIKLKAHSVDPVKLPTEFAELNEDLSVFEKPFIDCSGCENKDISKELRVKLARAIENHPELIWDHWNPQDSNLRKKIAKLHNVSPEQVFITSGAISGIENCMKIFTKEGTNTGLLKPDWSGFVHFAEFHKNKINTLKKENFPFIIDEKDINEFVKEKKIEFMMFANPVPINGHLMEKDKIDWLLNKNPETLFIIDEADTITPNTQGASLATKHENVIFLGSLSKFFGLSGLRIGFLITPKKFSEHFRKTINCLEVSSLAILAGNIILDDFKYQKWTQDNVKESINILREACANTPFEISATPNCFACFIHSDKGNPFEDLKKFNIKILEAQFFGLPESVNGGRFNLSDPEKAKLVAQKIREISSKS
ncbi:hypothetical protein CMI43_03415 [Candidatus Pacearchaeota archaeon]|jgi:histidinol-phosphate/aromatic aminotransferase/cobyric acid decarboxylase-like protein|nr:hypothetical protein [Candidatus Pacearchaeota archaeon]|tara:strand:+ start:1405 stop:2514 length:1110 start_codon:yes stop_codon:yes gene_type:complete